MYFFFQFPSFTLISGEEPYHGCTDIRTHYCIFWHFNLLKMSCRKCWKWYFWDLNLIIFWGGACPQTPLGWAAFGATTFLPPMYTCQLSRLRRESRAVENFDLTPAYACGPISHAWLKNVSCCRLAWHNFQKYVNSDPCKERKSCVKWINDNTFLAISDFVDKRFLDNFAFGRLRTSSEEFGLLRESSEMIVSFSKIRALPG